MELGRPPIRTAAKLRDRRPKPKNRIVIPLSSKPRDYVPGSGPPLQRISLLPPADSTAYIVERILLPSPGLAPNGKPLPKRMTYIVGWRDLPAATLLVPAMKILNYVSPRALEEWEWDLEMQLDEDRKKLVEERKKELEQPVEERNRTGKKRGRPPAHTAIEAGAVAEEPETDAQARHKAGAMSLSTPNKKRLEEFEGLSDDENMSPSRQLARESAWETGDDSGEAYEGVMELDYDAVERAGWERPMDVFNEASDSRDTFGESALGPPNPLFGTSSGTQSPYETPPSTALSRERNPGNGALPNRGFVSFTPTNGTFTSQRADSAPLVKRERSSATRSKAEPRKTNPSKRPRPRPSTSSSSKSARASAPESKPVVDESGEPAWVVQCIQGVELYEVEGRGLVRYFKVLWEGEWPPDQNPTWEPEENLPANLVRNYCKQDRKRRRATARIKPASAKKPVPVPRTTATKARPPLPKPKLVAEKQYKSVSDAFTGGEEAEDLGLVGSWEESTPSGGEPSHQGGDDDADEELLVVDEAAEEPKATPSWRGAAGPFGAFLF
ncbi:hypothetical protein JDV02_003328 [Purpureocillium takamizusanense]|uniref:Chromo domain-containing protein n=1 Tax=Purpureocillium takamizusanense TaxID=2060973 RepID=A0A9Q8QD01_9HYPO|nr:uncharacterized protein JDV02_003328 [Purpureocillium takamizusanense]UNI16946.1 hypothetical protein JDV02_003328 [Purpureocillium takamizusanense]